MLLCCLYKVVSTKSTKLTDYTDIVKKVAKSEKYMEILK